MRRRILRSNTGPIPVSISTQKNAVFHVRTHHDKELSRLSKRANRAIIEFPSTQYRNNNYNGIKEVRANAPGILPNGDVQPQVQERRTRREVKMGTKPSTSQCTALVPVPARPQHRELTKFDGDNNVRFKIQVTDQKGAERPTKILATLAKKSSIQRKDGVVKLTRSGFHTPTIREIGSNEDICLLNNDQNNEELKSSKNAHDLWNEALVKYAGNVQNAGDNPKIRARNQVSNRHPTQPSNSRNNTEKHWESESKQKTNDKQEYPDNQVLSPIRTSSTSDQGSEESITRSNETGSNLYGSREYRQSLRDHERYQQGASILKTATPYPGTQLVHNNDMPYCLKDNPQFAGLQPQFQYYPPVDHSVQPCATCQYEPCSACGALICIVCMAEPCISCSAPLCSACNIESNSANNETLCMSCTLKQCSPYYAQLAYNRSASSGELNWDSPKDQYVPLMKSDSNDQPRKRILKEPRIQMINPGYRSNPSSNDASPELSRTALAHKAPRAPYSRSPSNFRQEYQPRPDFPEYRYPVRGALPPGYPSSLSPCSPFIDFAARRKLPPLIPNYVCEVPPPQFMPGVCDDSFGQSPSMLPRKNKFLQLMAAKRSEVNTSGCPSTTSCGCPQENIGGDGTSVICPANWYACPRPQNPNCPEYYDCCPVETCISTLVHIAMIVVPVILTYVLGYYGMTRLLGLNKFSRLAAVLANTTMLYILTLEPDDLIMYPTDKPKVSRGHAGGCPPSMSRCSPIPCPSPFRGTPGPDFSYTEPNRPAP